MAKKRVKFTFPTDRITSPIIYDLGHRYKLVTNVRSADVKENMGWVILELEGNEEEIDNGIRWVESLNVQVDPVSGDVLEG